MKIDSGSDIFPSQEKLICLVRFSHPTWNNLTSWFSEDWAGNGASKHSKSKPHDENVCSSPTPDFRKATTICARDLANGAAWKHHWSLANLKDVFLKYQAPFFPQLWALLRGSLILKDKKGAFCSFSKSCSWALEPVDPSGRELFGIQDLILSYSIGRRFKGRTMQLCYPDWDTIEEWLTARGSGRPWSQSLPELNTQKILLSLFCVCLLHSLTSSSGITVITCKETLISRASIQGKQQQAPDHFLVCVLSGKDGHWSTHTYWSPQVGQTHAEVSNLPGAQAGNTSQLVTHLCNSVALSTGHKSPPWHWQSSDLVYASNSLRLFSINFF